MVHAMKTTCKTRLLSPTPRGPLLAVAIDTQGTEDSITISDRGPKPTGERLESPAGEIATFGLGFQVCEYGIEFGDPAFSIGDEMVGQPLPVLGRRLVRNVLQHPSDLLHGQPYALHDSGHVCRV